MMYVVHTALWDQLWMWIILQKNFLTHSRWGLDLCTNTYMYILNTVMLHLPHKHTQVPLEENFQKRLEYEFHRASYHTMIEVVTSLRTVAGHLVKVQPAVTLCK